VLGEFKGTDDRGITFNLGGAFAGSSSGSFSWNGIVRVDGSHDLTFDVVKTGTVTYNFSVTVERLL
jgi:hypothetical protein